MSAYYKHGIALALCCKCNEHKPCRSKQQQKKRVCLYCENPNTAEVDKFLDDIAIQRALHKQAKRREAYLKEEARRKGNINYGALLKEKGLPFGAGATLEEKAAAAEAGQSIRAYKAERMRENRAAARGDKPLTAEQELARREMARRWLLEFIKRFSPNYQAGWFHVELCGVLQQFLEDVIAQRSPRLMVFVPPRHGKSTVVSQYFPAWAFGNHPELEFISASYSQSLQMDFSRKVQEIIRDEDYQRIFPNTTILKDNESVERWATGFADGKRAGGGMLAAGVGGPITGRGAHVLAIDDPVKNRQEADSETVRKGVKDWYSSTALTRLAPGGGVIVVQTRWHTDDLSGWLLELLAEAEREYKETGVWPADADRWQVLNYPALAVQEETHRHVGEALHPERYPISTLLKYKRSMAPRDWAALYQQSPYLDEGAYFNSKWFRYYDGRPPSPLDIYVAGDLAISSKTSADFTVFVIAGLAADDCLYMLDERRGRWGTDEIVEQILDIYRVWKPRRFGIEKGQISMAIGPHLERRVREERLYGLVVEELPPHGRGDKEARARPFQGRLQRGQVLFPKTAPWTEAHVNELLRFPTGVKDDRVDADAWVGQMTANAIYSHKTSEKREENWRDRLRGYVSGETRKTTHMAA